MKRAFALLLSCALLPWFSPVLAEQVSGLYEAELPVTSQSAADRAEVLRAAFEVVLVKVSGRGEAAREPALAEALRKPDRYVQQFRYRTGPTGGLTFWALFDSEAVNRLLRSQRLPVWGSARPTTVLWLAVEERNGRRLIGSADNGVWSAAVTATAGARGLPVRLPLLDLADQGRIRASDVFGDFREVLLGAAARYRAQAIIAAALLHDGDRYRGRFTLYQDVRTVQWEVTGTAEQVITAGLHRAADEIAVVYTEAPVGGAQKATVAVQIGNVRSLDDYRGVMQYLGDLNGVSRVEPEVVAADQLRLRITVQGGARALTQAIALGDSLVSEPLAQGTETPGGVELRYRLK